MGRAHAWLLNPSVGSYSGCGAVLEGAIEAMEGHERHRAMDLALHLKTPGEAGAQGIERDWPEFSDSFSKEDARTFDVSPRSVIRIKELIALVKDGTDLDRGRALRRLHMLYTAGKLASPQSEALGSAIWANCGESRWPCESQYNAKRWCAY